MKTITTNSGLFIESKENETILQSALTNGFIFEYSCETGQCGVCETKLLEGEVVEVKEQKALTKDAKASGKILTCCCSPQTDILIDAEDLSALHGIEIKILPARISHLQLLSAEILEVKLRIPPTASLEFLEGQHLDVIGPNGVRRSYSVANSVDVPELTLLIKKVELGEFSNYWFNIATPNDLLRIEGPKGTFYLRDKARSLVFLATGTGIASVISMLDHLDLDENFVQSREIYVFWGNRSAQDFIWQPCYKNINIDFNPVLSRPTDTWDGAIGYVQDEALGKLTDLTQMDVYACGSNEMIISAKQVFIRAGLETKYFYSDAFVSS